MFSPLVGSPGKGRIVVSRVKEYSLIDMLLRLNDLVGNA